MGIFDIFKKKKGTSISDDSSKVELLTVKIKPSLYYTYDKKSKLEETNEHITKEVSLRYVISTKELLIEGMCRNKGKLYYYPFMKCDPHSVDEIFDICKNLFQKMDLDAFKHSSEQLDIIKYFGVKTYGGACRKFELFSFQYDRRWNQLKEDYYFCKGERNRDGYSLYVDYVIGDDLTKDEFVKGYNKELVKIEKRLARKEQKKLEKNTAKHQ